MAKGFDVAPQLDAALLDEQATLSEIYDRDGTLMEGVSITGYCVDSRIYRDAQQHSQQLYLNALRRGGNPSAKEMESWQMQALAKSVASWKGFTNGSDEWPASRENVLTLFRIRPDIKDQWRDFVNMRSNFVSDSAKPSAS